MPLTQDSVVITTAQLLKIEDEIKILKTAARSETNVKELRFVVTMHARKLYRLIFEN